MKKITVGRSFGLILSVLAISANVAWGQILSGSNPNASDPNLQLWLNAGAGVTESGDGTDATAWANQATSGAAVGDATVGASTGLDGLGNTVTTVAPTFVASSSSLNGAPALSFNGYNQGLDIANASSLLANGTYTAFIVYTPGSIAYPGVGTLLNNNGGIIYQQATDPGAYLGLQNGTSPNYDYSTIRSSANALTSGQSYVLTLSSAGPSAGQTQLLIDGVENDNAQGVTALGTAAIANLGYEPGTDRYVNGQIAEVLIYNTDLSTSDIMGIDTYLGDKYDIDVPVVPEPSTADLLLMATGLFFLVKWIRRHRQDFAAC